MRYEFYADSGINCPVVLVILISNTAVNTYETHCEASSQVMKQEGRISSQLYANKKTI